MRGAGSDLLRRVHEHQGPMLTRYSLRTFVLSPQNTTSIHDTRAPVLADAHQSEPSVVLVSGQGASEHDSFNGACNAKIVTPPPSVDGISAVGRMISGMHPGSFNFSRMYRITSLFHTSPNDHALSFVSTVASNVCQDNSRCERATVYNTGPGRTGSNARETEILRTHGASLCGNHLGLVGRQRDSCS